jgi:hypothetical protein
MYIPGGSTPYASTGGLYKYDASTAAGLVLVKEITDLTDVTCFIPPSDFNCNK